MIRSSLLVASLLAIAVFLNACQPEEAANVPISGKIDIAVGESAPLTVQDGVGTGFSLSAVLGSANIAVTSAEWKCYSPAPPNFVNFDIEATDGQTFGLFISVSPDVWEVGSIPIDNEKVRLQLSTTDRFGIATNGTLVLQSAGTLADTAGHTCKFSMQDVALFGERAGP